MSDCSNEILRVEVFLPGSMSIRPVISPSKISGTLTVSPVAVICVPGLLIFSISEIRIESN
jgi:hypothetical protein